VFVFGLELFTAGAPVMTGQPPRVRVAQPLPDRGGTVDVGEPERARLRSRQPKASYQG
jgi:hypothetical protein